MKIGVFDSGVGGLSVANAIQKAFPEYEILLREDSENLPYGNKTPAVILEFVKPILQELIDEGCDCIVIACNTVSTTLITELRELFPVPLIAVEPMVKPAAEQTKSKVIAVCATPTTLASKRYKFLKDEYADDVKVLEPDCHDWASMIQEDKVNHQLIAERIGKVLDQGADVIVLGCTHYHWIQEEINKLAVGRAIVIQPEQAIIKRLKTILEQQI